MKTSTPISPINTNIEHYLDYYLSLNTPKYAVLIKGDWGSGKTWFINKYKDKIALAPKAKQSLYVSLYGMKNINEIQESLFNQYLQRFVTFPAFVRKIIEAVFTLCLQYSRLDLQKIKFDTTRYYLGSSFSVLIFDDLERCHIPLAILMGYINNFVESRDFKVIILANETLIKSEELKIYQKTKEKLIGQTLEIQHDFDGAYQNFVNKEVTNNEIIDILDSVNAYALIKNVFDKAESKNLRILRQIILDFQRIFQALPKITKNKDELIQDLLIVLTTLSILVKTGELDTKKINTDDLATFMTEEIQGNNINNVITKMMFFNPSFDSPYPSYTWWQKFFDKGIVDQELLDNTFQSSKYIKNDKDWIKLYHYYQLSDDEFQKILTKVESQYLKGEYQELGIIKHIFCLLLNFSEMGLYKQDKPSIVNNAIELVENLVNNNKLSNYNPSFLDVEYDGLSFHKHDLSELKKFNEHIQPFLSRLKNTELHKKAYELLEEIKVDHTSFGLKLEPRQFYNVQETYFTQPILNYLDPKDFFDVILSLDNYQKKSIFSVLADRYKSPKLYQEESKFIEGLTELIEEYVKGNDLSLSKSLMKQYWNWVKQNFTKI